MVLSPALLFLGARQFRVPVHAVSEGLAALGQGACSLRALLEVVGVARLQRPRPTPASRGHQPAAGRFQHQPVAQVAEEGPHEDTGSDLCGTQLPQPVCPALRASRASPSPSCDPGLFWCPWGSASQPEAPLVGGRGGPLPLWAPRLRSQAGLVGGDGDCLPIDVLWPLMGRHWQTFGSVLCV